MTRIAVKAIIRRENKFLILKQKPNEYGFSFWELPGGKLEQGETGEEGIVREVKEETNLDVKNLQVLNTETVIANNESWTKILFRTTINDFSNLKLDPDEHVEYKWITHDEIPSDSENSLIKDFEIYENSTK